MAQQTSVEWLFERINLFCMFTDGIPDEWSEALEQAKQMEKEQIIDAWQEAYVTGCVVGSNDYTNENEETDNGAYYYDQTYNQNK